MHGDSHGGFPPRDNDHHSNAANPNILARGREHQPSGAYEPQYGQDNRSWKDQSRSPSRRHQEGDSSHGPGDYQDYQDHQDHPSDYLPQHQQRHHHRSYPPHSRGERSSSSRDRGDYRPYQNHNRDRHAYGHDRRSQPALRYDDDYDDVGDRRLHYDDDSHRSQDYSPPREHRGHRDRDGDRRGPYRGRQDDDYSYRRERSLSPNPGEPSETVLVEGIMPDVEESDVNFGLHALQLAGLQDIRIRRERNSSRRIAFLEFNSVPNATTFVESYPDLTVTLVLPHNAPTKSCRVRISYSWARRDESWKDWRCTQCVASNYSSRHECYKCGEPKPRQGSAELDDSPIHTGEKDACPNQKPYHIVVVTGLETSTSEEVFAKGVMKLYVDNTEEKSQQPTGPVGLKTTAPVGNTKGLGARPNSLRRVLLIRDRKSRASWKYGFAEFATTEDAVKAVSKFQASPRFTIASKPVTVAYIHTGVFVPVLPPEPQVEPFVFAALHNPDIKLRYWEYRAYANPHIVSTQLPVDAPSPQKADGQGKKEKKRKAEKEAGGAKKKSLVMAPQMQMWANKSAEIRGESSNKTPLGERRVEYEPTPKTLDAPMPEIGTVLPKSEPIWSYADLQRKCCLLCKRKFGSIEQLRKHEIESTLHQDNLKDDGKKDVATKALAVLGLEASILEGSTQYRDRAKERRAVHNQPIKPSQAPSKKEAVKGDKKATTERTAAGPAPAAAPAKMSKGMAMLSKMGLKAGEGLGADGSGRKDIISTDMYKPGVGLGAEGAKLGDAGEEAARATKNEYGDFLKKTQDKARERFQNLSKEGE